MINKNNKTCIFNFWFGAAYGGILTAYALQEVLRTLNCFPILADNRTLTVKILSNKYNFTKSFWTKYFNLSKDFSKFSNLLQESSDTKIFITGSDQVLRPKYVSDLSQYLLDFVTPDKKKIAFSASFGVDKEQFLKENSKITIEHMKNSLRTFDVISVREKSGVEICRDVLGVEAEWIIDPVFILRKEKYYDLAKKSMNVYKNKIVSYVLDTNNEYKKAKKYISKKYNKKIIETANSNNSVGNWLASIRDCDLFITDSFHGMCFAIIFNKPFICIANHARGISRFESVCEILGIENQCIHSINEVYERDCVFKIDYKQIETRITEERQKGLDFLQKIIQIPAEKQKEKESIRTRYLENYICKTEKQLGLKHQLFIFICNLWLIVWHKYLPNFIKNMINNFRRSESER